ncbi:winged helix-turn-helix transcriptional regulator [Nonomuraea jabiensis]|uniref:winged helix-turn-helix transcriptional regulator n=1 Tax=Nonomuraea jabiensis TaxID=882448 RepID=UPI003680D68F
MGERTLRFSELRDEVEGISHKMLTQNLRMLERNGLAERQGVPVALEQNPTNPSLTCGDVVLCAKTEGLPAWR